MGSASVVQSKFFCDVIYVLFMLCCCYCVGICHTTGSDLLSSSAYMKMEEGRGIRLHLWIIYKSCIAYMYICMDKYVWTFLAKTVLSVYCKKFYCLHVFSGLAGKTD